MRELNDKTFDKAIKSKVPVAVDFWAEWCMPCRIFAPVLEEMSGELDGKAEFYKLNIDDFPDLALKYGVEVIPTVVIFKDGKPVDKTVGVLTREEFRLTLEKYI